MIYIYKSKSPVEKISTGDFLYSTVNLFMDV